MRLNSRWFVGVNDPETKSELEVKIGNSKVILDRLYDILLADLESIEKPKLEDYETPFWPALQADKNGQARALRKVLDLINIQETTSE